MSESKCGEFINEIFRYFENENLLERFLALNINFFFWGDVCLNVLQTVDQDIKYSVLSERKKSLTINEVEIVFDSKEYQVALEWFLIHKPLLHHSLNLYPFLISRGELSRFDLSFIVSNTNCWIPSDWLGDLTPEARNMVSSEGKIWIPEAQGLRYPKEHEDIALRLFYQNLHRNHFDTLFGNYGKIETFPQRKYILHLFSDEEIEKICLSSSIIDRDFILFNMAALHSRLPRFVNYFKDESRFRWLLSNCSKDEIRNFRSLIDEFSWVDEILGTISDDNC